MYNKLKIMIIQLVDRNQDMVDAWNSEFFECDDVTIHCDDFFALETDCIVSPANSFGFMDGGLDGVITQRLGPYTQINLQNKIAIRPIKELLVGEAMLVATENDKIPWCISAPTMRVPATLLKNTPNVYLATKAIFGELLDIAHDRSSPDIKKVTISGLGTGVGRVPYDICAQQMKKAYDEVWLGKFTSPRTWYEASQRHQLLYTDINNTRDLQHPSNNDEWDDFHDDREI